MLHPAALHDLLALLNVLLFAVLNNFPELIREGIYSLVQFVLGGFILTEIGELIAEVIEVPNELFKLLLLGVRPVDEFEVLLLHVVEAGGHSLSLDSDLSEHLLHLTLVCLAQLLPYPQNSGFEVAVNIAYTGLLSWDSLCCGLGSLNLCLFFLGLATFCALLLTLLALFFLLDGSAHSLGLFLFSGLKRRIDLRLDNIISVSLGLQNTFDNFLDL